MVGESDKITQFVQQCNMFELSKDQNRNLEGNIGQKKMRDGDRNRMWQNQLEVAFPLVTAKGKKKGVGII